LAYYINEKDESLFLSELKQKKVLMKGVRKNGAEVEVV